MTTPVFTKQDADNLVNHAANAPLRNLHEAAQVDALIRRFTAWYEHIATPPPPQTEA